MIDFVLIGLFLVGCGVFSRCLRTIFLGGWNRAEALLAEVVLFSSAVLLTSELMGLVALFSPIWLAVVGLLLGGVAFAVGTRFDREVIPAPRTRTMPAASRWSVPVAVACVALTLVVWSSGISQSLDSGIYRQDSMWYHLTFAAGFVQDGQIGGLHLTDPLKLAAWFYPQSSEIFHAIGMLALDGDFASPFINLGWAGLTLLAAWTVGRSWGMPATTTIAATAILITPMMIVQSGNGTNDITGMAFLTATIALLVSAKDHGWQRSAIAVAGLAAGIAIGTKLTLLAPVAVLTIGIMILIRTGEKLVSSAIWLGALATTGAFWYLRNVIISGNPLPWIDLGPLHGPDQIDLYPRPPHSIADYVGHPGSWLSQFVPGLSDTLGDAWPLMLLLAAAGVVILIVARGDGLLRAVAYSAIALAVAHVFLPISASGQFGAPSGFSTNLRYAAPALLTGLLCATAAAARFAEKRRLICSGLLLVTLVITAVGVIPSEGRSWILALVLLAVAAVAVLISGTTLDRSQRWIVLGAMGIGLAFTGSSARSDYIEHRYDPSRMPTQDTPGFRASAEWQPLQEWAGSIKDRRIGVVGPSSVFAQYIFYGDDLSNRVSFIGEPGPHGSMRPAGSCEQWRRTVNRNELDFLVFTPPASSGSPFESEEAFWTRTDPNARELVRSEPASIFILLGELDPALCRAVRNVKMIPGDWGGMSPVPVESFPPPPQIPLEAMQGLG